MRKCKVCNVEKEYIYFTLNEQGRAVYKDSTGKIWHGRKCSDCHTKYVKTKANKKPLSLVKCIDCNSLFQQKTIRQTHCSNHYSSDKKNIIVE